MSYYSTVNTPTAALLLAALLKLNQCKSKDDPAPVHQLPPATQTGGNTFGCLLNGQQWTPSGNNGRPNLQVTYDPDYSHGALQIKAYRYAGPERSILQAITIGAAAVNAPGVYSFSLEGPNGIYYSDYGRAAGCIYYGGQTLSYRTGKMTITRFDSGVVAGTFTFQLSQPGCDTIKVTQGRFDARF